MATRVLTVKVAEDLIEVLGDTAQALGISRNALARQALESVVDPDAVTEAREQREGREIRSRLEDEQALIESGAVNLAHLRTPSGPIAESSSFEPATFAPLPECEARAAIMLDVRIRQLSRVVDHATCEAVRVAAIEARGEARMAKMELILPALLKSSLQ